MKIEELKFVTLTIEQKNKIISNANTIFQEAKEKKEIYMNQIDEINLLRESYDKYLKKLLNEFEKIEKNYNEVVKDSLRKYNIYYLAFIRNLEFDLEKQRKVNRK